jgi:hypothetical protein
VATGNPDQGGIQRAYVELQRAARHLLEPRGNREAVQGAERVERLEHHEVERSLKRQPCQWLY